MAQDEKRRIAAERAKEARERFKGIVPEPVALDGLPVLHTFRVPIFLGRPLEVTGWIAVVFLWGAIWAFLVMIPDWNPWISIPCAAVAAWRLGQRFFRGDGKTVKNPYLRSKHKGLINYTVGPGPIRPMNERYEVIKDGVAVNWEDHASE